MSNLVVILSPVVTETKVEILSGYDYFASEGKALRWTLPGTSGPGALPNLTGATFHLTLVDHDYAGSLLLQDAGRTIVQVELSAAQTVVLSPQKFSLFARLSNEHLFVLAEGIFQSS